MKYFQIAHRVGAVAIVVALIVAILSPSARPSLRLLLVVLVIAAAAGLVIGLLIRRSLSLDQRLRVMHQISPQLARRLLPPPTERNRD